MFARLRDTLGRSEGMQKAFRDALIPRPFSIDRFLEHRPELIEIGKEAIAVVLTSKEKRDSLDSIAGDRTWMHLLLERMNAAKDEWRKNMLSVITFNYDRSFEYFMLAALQVRFGLPLDDACELLTSSQKS